MGKKFGSAFKFNILMFFEFLLENLGMLQIQNDFYTGHVFNGFQNYVLTDSEEIDFYLNQ